MPGEETVSRAMRWKSAFAALKRALVAAVIVAYLATKLIFIKNTTSELPQEQKRLGKDAITTEMEAFLMTNMKV